jgi:hypothetical protein
MCEGEKIHETLYDDGFIGPGPYHDDYPEDHTLPYYENMSEEDWL